MPALGTGAMREVARALIYDGTASRNDGEILTRLVELGSADRAAIDEIEAHVSDEQADALGNGFANFEPYVEVVKDGDEVVGALIKFERNLDGDHEYGTTWVYDHTAHKLIGSVEWGYERDTEFFVD